MALVALILALVVGDATATQVGDFDAALYRTKRGADLTLVDGVLEFDPRIVQGGADCAYEVLLNVTDSNRTPIFEDRWRGVLACGPEETAQLAERNARVVETFQFAVMPGLYSLQVSIEPAGVPELVRTKDLELRSLSPDEPASDLILARKLGLVDSTEMGQWTVQMGRVGIAADPHVIVDPDERKLSYYLELYGESDEPLEGQVQGVIRGEDGTEVVRMALAELNVGGEGRPIAGAISLRGLPPGDYRLEVELPGADRVVTRSRPFRLADPPVEAVAESESPTGDRFDTYFWSLTDAELAELFDPVVIWLATGEQRKLFESLDPDGKRRFLATYFREIAPVQLGGVGDAPLDIYLRRVTRVNARFSERAGREAQAAWRTDRGRVYLLRGEPDVRRERPFPIANAYPYEIWIYDIAPRYVYLFVDETRFGNYRLLFSTDPGEPAPLDWQRRAGQAAIGELNDLGVRTPAPN